MAELIEPRVLKGFRDFLPTGGRAPRPGLAKLGQVFRPLRLLPDRHPGAGVRGGAAGQGRRRDRQAGLPVHRPRRPGRGPALRPDRAVRPVHGRAPRRAAPARSSAGTRPRSGGARTPSAAATASSSRSISTSWARIRVGRDLEILLLMRESFLGLGLGSEKVHYAHRGVFNAFLARLRPAEKTVDPARHRQGAQDRQGQDAGDARRDRRREGRRQRARLLARSAVSFGETLERLAEAAGPTAQGVKRLDELGACLESSGACRTFVLDPSITRGLDYYTGIVFETFLDRPAGHRLGVLGRPVQRPRLAVHQAEAARGRGLHRAGPADGRPGGARRAGSRSAAGPRCWSCCSTRSLLGSTTAWPPRSGQAGIAAEVYPEPRKLAVQFAYAEKRAIPLAVFLRRARSRAAGCEPEGPAQPPEPRGPHARRRDSKSAAAASVASEAPTWPPAGRPACATRG